MTNYITILIHIVYEIQLQGCPRRGNSKENNLFIMMWDNNIFSLKPKESNAVSGGRWEKREDDEEITIFIFYYHYKYYL